MQVTMPIGGTAAIPVPQDLRDLFEASASPAQRH
jgi:hypothetical protein